MEVMPQYTIRPNLKRTLFPNFIKLVLLSTAFFAGVIINLRLLNIRPPSAVIWLIVVILIVLSAAQVLLTHISVTKIRYNFFIDRIEKQDKKPETAYYSQVQGMQLKRSFLDKLFGTATIVLQPDFKVERVGNAKQVFYYLQQLVQRAGGASGLPPYQQPPQQQNYQTQRTA